MKNECKLKPVYKKRIDEFFGEIDKNNCQRVYEKIKQLDEEDNISVAIEKNIEADTIAN